MAPVLKKVAATIATIGTLVTIGLSAGCPALVGDPVKGTIRGRAIKGPIAGGAVSVFAVDDDGKKTGDAVGRGVTDETGSFTVDVGGLNGPALVCVDAGSYVEEATGTLVELADNSLCALVDDHKVGQETTGVLVTPFSTWHATLARCFVTAGRDTSLGTASAHAALRLNDFLAAGLSSFDLRTSAPFDATAAVAPSLTPDVWAGVLLAGLSESAKAHALASGLEPGVRVTAATLSAAADADLGADGCVFDGNGQSGVLAQGTLALSADTLRGAPQGLGAGILRFLENPERNLSGITADDVKDLVTRINEHQSEIFGAASVTGDVDPPGVSFLSPEDGAAVAGVITVNVSATDASPLASLVFVSPSRIAGTAAICDQPNSCTLSAQVNTSLEPAGDLVLSARATDEAGNTTEGSITVTINDSLPNIAVVSPLAGSEVSGSVALSATASDADGIRSLTLSGLDEREVTITSLRTDELTGTWNTLLHPEGPAHLVFVTEDERGARNEVGIDVVVDNLDDGIINGTVDVGGVVTGAAVTAFALSSAGRGAPVATAVTDEETGAFSLTNPFYSGPLLLVVGGGSYVDPATGLTQTLRGGQELLAAIGNVQPGETTLQNVNAWTTFAAARALVTLDANASNGPDGTNVEDAVSENTERIGLHLRRDGPERNPLPIDSTASVDLSTTTIESTNDRAVLSLAHAGLSRTALELSDAAGLDPGAITLVDVVERLKQDVRNGLYDGVDGEGDPVAFDPARTLFSTPLTLRTDLASAINSFLTDAPLDDGTTFDRNHSGIATELLFGAGNFYSDIAENNDFRLFSTPGEPFDIVPPQVGLVFESEPGAPVGSARIERDVRILGQAEDIGSGINRFEVVFPEGLLNTSPLTSELRVTVAPSLGPNMTQLTGACSDAVEADPALSALDPALQFCLCTEAADGTENVTHNVFCFTRPAPRIEVASPAADATFNTADTSIGFSATITGGWAVLDCQMTASPGLDVSVAPAADNTCFLSGTAQRSSYTDGEHELVVSTRDVAGNVGEARQRFFVETVAPTVSITSPAPSQALQTPSYTVTGTVEDPSIARVELTLTRTFGTTTEAVFAGAQNATLTGSGATRTWSKAITDAGNNKSGRRDLTARAFDTQGNASAPVTVSFVVDDLPPLQPGATPLNFKLEGGAIAVERSGFNSCVIGSFCGVDTRVPAPAANRPDAVVLFASAGAVSKTIERWSTRVDDSASAPELSVSGTDVGGAGIREVRFALAATCATSVTALSRSIASTGTASLKLTAAATGFDLKNTHQTDTATPLCLSVATVDRAGNTSAIKNLFFRWRTIAPPPNLSAITSTGLGDSLDASAQSGDGVKFATWLRGQAGSYRVLHVYVHNPHGESISAAPGDLIDFAISLSTTLERRFSASRATLWAGSPTHSLRNPFATDAQSNPSTTILPTWHLGALGSSNPRIWALSNTCGAGDCAANAVVDANPPCGLSPSCDELDATFNDATVESGTRSRELFTTTPTVTCHNISSNGLPIPNSPCTADGAPFFIVPAHTTVLFSWITNHSRGQREFLAPGWGSGDVNPSVPFFDDDDTGANRSTLQVQTPSLSRNVVLWLKDSAGRPLPRSLLWTDRNAFLRCGGTSDANVVECHAGREYTHISGATVEASVSSLRMKTRHGVSTTNRADAVFDGSGATTPIPASATRNLLP